jgi:hypothetical protein
VCRFKESVGARQVKCKFGRGGALVEEGGELTICPMVGSRRRRGSVQDRRPGCVGQRLCRAGGHSLQPEVVRPGNN